MASESRPQTLRTKETSKTGKLAPSYPTGYTNTKPQQRRLMQAMHKRIHMCRIGIRLAVWFTKTDLPGIQYPRYGTVLNTYSTFGKLFMERPSSKTLTPRRNK